MCVRVLPWASWQMALEVKWPVKPLQPEPLREKRKCEASNKRPLLCTNNIHQTFLAEWLFNCRHLDALTLVLLTTIRVLRLLWRDKAYEHTNQLWLCETHTHTHTLLISFTGCLLTIQWEAQLVVLGCILSTFFLSFTCLFHIQQFVMQFFF